MDYSTINNEEELHNLLSKSENFEERKKIRGRLRELREQREKEWELKRQQREKETEDLIRKKYEIADQEKQKKMQAFQEQAASRTESRHLEVAEKTLKEKMKLADEEKQRKLEAYDRMARKEDVHTTSTVHTETKDGKTVTVRKTETVTKVGGTGGTSYGKPAAKPVNPFKKMDAQNNPGGKTNPLVAFTYAKKAANTMRRNAVTIKQDILAFCQANTAEYEKVQITNFSSSWNDGLAFCALIHHFYPDAFDFWKLESKNRRYNFNLAFDTAENLADIAPLLDVEDMVRMKKPDWKCVFTYVQSFYRKLRDHENNKAA